MKRLCAMVALAGLAALATACSRIDVKTDHDPAVDFSGVKTYRWEADPVGAPPADPAAQEEQAFVRECVHRAVDRELAAKGMTRDAASPDVLVTFAAASRDKLQLQGSKETGWTFRDRLLYPGWIEGTPEIYYDVGTLILDMVSPRNGKLLGRGTAEGTIPKNIDRTGLQRDIDEAVSKMLEAFPPAPRS